MSRSRSRSASSRAAGALAAALLAAGAAGCPDGGQCGPGAAAADGLSLAGTGVDVRYEGLAASANNDCPDPTAPAGIVALTISGTQVGTSFPVTLCVQRPDRLGATPLQLGTDVVLFDLSADAGGGCSLALPTTGGASGTVTATGLCDQGTNGAGFALTVDGVVPLKRTCGTQVDTLDLALTGTVAVSGPP